MVDKHLIFYYVGIAIIVLTHLFMILTNPSMRIHSLINLVAVCAVAYYFLNKEGYIGF